jgi:hypothetical protein
MEDETGSTYSIHAREVHEKFWYENLREWERFAALVVYGRIILK